MVATTPPDHTPTTEAATLLARFTEAATTPTGPDFPAKRRKNQLRSLAQSLRLAGYAPVKPWNGAPAGETVWHWTGKGPISGTQDRRNRSKRAHKAQLLRLREAEEAEARRQAHIAANRKWTADRRLRQSIARQLEKAGWQLVHTSRSEGRISSRYYLRHGLRLRLADHWIGDAYSFTGQRIDAADRGRHDLDLVIDRGGWPHGTGGFEQDTRWANANPARLVRALTALAYASPQADAHYKAFGVAKPRR